MVGSPLVGYEDLERDSETGLLHPQIEGPRQGHEWMETVVFDLNNAPHKLPHHSLSWVEILDVRTLFYIVHRNDGIVFDLFGSRYQATREEVIAADNRHASKNGCKILANVLMEGLYERNPDWRPYMRQIPFEALRLGDSAAMGPLDQSLYDKEAELRAERAKTVTATPIGHPEP